MVSIMSVGFMLMGKGMKRMCYIVRMWVILKVWFRCGILNCCWFGII